MRNLHIRNRYALDEDDSRGSASRVVASALSKVEQRPFGAGAVVAGPRQAAPLVLITRRFFPGVRRRVGVTSGTNCKAYAGGVPLMVEIATDAGSRYRSCRRRSCSSLVAAEGVRSRHSSSSSRLPAAGSSLLLAGLRATRTRPPAGTRPRP